MAHDFHDKEARLGQEHRTSLIASFDDDLKSIFKLIVSSGFQVIYDPLGQFSLFDRVRSHRQFSIGCLEAETW